MNMIECHKMFERLSRVIKKKINMFTNDSVSSRSEKEVCVYTVHKEEKLTINSGTY